MDHIKQYDWCSSEPDVYFLNEPDMDNSVTEKILSNKFVDPLISSDSEDEKQPKIQINWNEIFNKKKQERSHRIVVPGIHPPPHFPKLSALSQQQHMQCLRVLCADQPHILPAEFLPRPTKHDRKTFEELKETYAKEQQEFIEWAKSLWTSSHCVRALRPKPPIEMVYESEFKMTAHKMQSFPKNYSIAAQIPLETANAVCEMVHEKDLLNVNLTALPKINIPDMSEKVFIMKPYPVPEPCNKHPCRFQLPGESDMTILPLTEVHNELAQFACDNGAQCVASEEALRCLMQLDESWLLCLSVCKVIGDEGPRAGCVLEGPLWLRRAPPPQRAARAFRTLLQHALAPPVNTSEKRKRRDSTRSLSQRQAGDHDTELSDEDDDNLFIDTSKFDDNSMESEDAEDNIVLETLRKDISNKSSKEGSAPKTRNSGSANENKIDFYTCTCNDTFDKPPPRSYKKWKVVNWATKDKYSIVVHCPHRVRGQSGELVLEPIPEYQVDLGASQQSLNTLQSQVLALTLRKNAAVLNVRIDGPSGEIVTTECVDLDDLLKQNVGVGNTVTNRLYTAIDQLQGLLPGHYILEHEPSHGDNAILYRSGAAGAQLTLEFASAAPAQPAQPAPDDSLALKTPPTLTPLLLPIHKFRKYLPCAFTPYPNLLARESKKPVTRQKTPPQAIKLGEAPGDRRTRGKWPKKKNKKRKKNNNNNS